jgi:ClpX C4-type zinc finger
MNSLAPPPIIDSMRTLWFAHVDDSVTFTDRICLLVDGEKLGRVDRLAICLNDAVPNDYVLCFCDANWQCKGVIAFASADEAKARAEIGYTGIDAKWQADATDEAEVHRFLREEYEVNPHTEWWKTECSFCGKDLPDVDGILAGKGAHIC